MPSMDERHLCFMREVQAGALTGVVNSSHLNSGLWPILRMSPEGQLAVGCLATATLMLLNDCSEDQGRRSAEPGAGPLSAHGEGWPVPGARHNWMITTGGGPGTQDYKTGRTGVSPASDRKRHRCCHQGSRLPHRTLINGI